MNFSEFDFGEKLNTELSAMEKSRRMPHAVIISGGDGDSRKRLCTMLSMWAVCLNEDNRPCTECSGCVKARGGSHIDIYHAKGSGKTDVVSVEEIRNITRDTAIIPNEAPRKVYVIYDADKRMGQEALNAFLKTLEEPPQDILFLLTAETPKTLPETIRSRCVTLTLDSALVLSEETMEMARDILEGIISMKELDLLKATSVLASRSVALEVLPAVRSVLSDALALSVSAKPMYDNEVSAQLRKRLTKGKIIRLIDATSDAINKVNRNVNLTLLSTWICGEYRRISWQK